MRLVVHTAVMSHVSSVVTVLCIMYHQLTLCRVLSTVPCVVCWQSAVSSVDTVLYVLSWHSAYHQSCVLDGL